MASHFDSFVRVSLVLGLTLVAMPLLKGRSASARRLVLSVAFGCALVIPFVPAWRVNAPVYRELVGRVTAEPIVQSLGAPVAVSSTVGRPIDWLVLIWALGVLLVAARFVIGLVLAQRLLSRSEAAPAEWAAAIAHAERKTGLLAVVRVSPEIEAPVLTGIVSPVVIVPSSSAAWTNERKHAVLLHELAHVAAHDLRVQVLATIVCSLHWFSPFAWLAARRLRLEREIAADEAVLRSGIRASDYASDLLAIAGAAPAGTVAIGEKPITKRITAILAARRPSILSAKAAVTLVAATTLVALGIACTTASESNSPVPVASARVDDELQRIADRELVRTIKEWKASSGTILVMSPKGEMLAEAGSHADRTYVTGSTIKPILLAAALDEGVVTESDVFDCSQGDRGGKRLHDASPLGRVAVPEMLARSSNVGFAQVFDRLGGARFDDALRRFRFATPPTLASAPPGDWDAGLVAIGVRMSATPRQIALAYATLANGGNGIVKRDTAARVSTLLEGVVASEQGTGKKARVSGVRVAGKTGSSDWTAPDGTKVTYASFVGYVPAEQPRYVIFVGIESPSGQAAWGGEVAAPVFSRVAASALTR